MATPTAAQRAQIVELYVAYFNRAPESVGLEFWAQKFADLTVLEAGNAGAALNTVANGMWDAAEGEVGYDEATDTSAFLDLVYQNVLGRTADADGKAFWAGKLDAGEVSRGEFILQFIGGINADNDPAGYERFNARNDVAELWSKEDFSAGLTDAEARAQGTAVISGIDTAAQAQAKITELIGTLPGNTILLTTGQDNLVGTSGNDTFKAYIFDNQNTLQSGDMIDGAGGTNNKLIADLGSSSNFAITPHTVRVQTIELRAQSKAHDSGDNNTIGPGGDTVDAPANVRIDAERSIGVTEWINNNSRAHLVIEDIRLDAINSNRPSDVAAVTQITKDVTLTLRNTDAGDVDFRVYFEANSLKAAPATREGAQLNIELMDTRAAVAGLDPLLNSPFDGFTFTLDGQTIRVQSDAIGNATTYAELLAAVQTAVAAIPALRDFTVAISGKFTATDTLSGTQAQGDVITLTNNGAGVVGSGNYLTPDGTVPGSSGLHLEQDTDAPLVIDSLVTSKIILDNVGRGEVSEAYAPGSAAGDVVVGSMATRGGVERFEVEVQRGSWIDSLNSTNNTLQEVQLVNGTSPEGQNTTAPGYVHIGASLQANSEYNNLVGWQYATRSLATNGLTDVRLIEATQFDGNIKIGAQITRAVFDKYLNAIDPDTGVANAEDVQFDYNLGKGNDNLNLSIDKFVTADVDFKLNINAGAGNNVIYVRLVDGDPAKTNASNGNWLTNQANLDNLSITTGDGNNTIFTAGRGDYAITTGRGNDTVYVDNTGAKAVFILRAASDSFADRAIRVSEAAGVLPLNNDIQSDAPATYVGAFAKVQLNFRGLTSEADISFDARNGQFTDLQVNQAIKTAINTDPVLSKLLVAKDGAGHSLIIESLIDGDTSIIDLTIGFAPITGATSATLPLFGGPAVGGVTPTSAATLAADYAPEFALQADPGATLVIGAGAFPTPGQDAVVDVQTITLDAAALATLTPGDLVFFTYGPINSPFIIQPGNTVALMAAQIQGLLGPTATAVAAGDVITITAATAGAVAAATLTEGGVDVGVVDVTTPGEAGVADVQTITLSAAEVAELTLGRTLEFIYDGNFNDFSLTAPGAAGLAADLNTVFTTFSIPATVSALGDVVTITANGPGVVDGPTLFALLNADYFAVTGSDSVSHSDNDITITGGNDVIVLGTNDTDAVSGTSVGSNDTVTFAASATDVKLTIVDFEAGLSSVAGFDTLDFTAFLGGAASAYDVGFAGLGGTAANREIALVSFGSLGTAGTVTFESLTAAQFQVAVNAATNADAVPATKNVFLVQDGADNVFKVFTTESVANSAEFTAVKLIGTVDLADTPLANLTFDNFA